MNSPFKRLLASASLAAILLTLLILLGNLHWFPQMLTHFRLPCALGFLTLIILLLICKLFKNALSITLCLILQLIPLSHHYLPMLKDNREGSGPQLKVISFNVLTSNPNKESVLQFLQNEQADIVCLQEVSTKWLAALRPLSAHYPYKLEFPRSDNFGLLILSKHFITNHQLNNSPSLATPYLTAEITWQDTKLTLINAHPTPPMSKQAYQANRKTLELIQSDSMNAQNSLIVVGDFNCSTYSPLFTPLKKALRDTSRGRGYPATWKHGHPLLGIPIDHILHSPDLICLHRRIGEQHGSDHSPIIATLQVAAN